MFSVRAKVVCIRANVVVLGQTSLFWVKVVVFEQSVSIRTNVVVIGQMW